MQNVAVYKSGKMTFYMYPKKIMFDTGIQAVSITCLNYQYIPYLDELKLDIIAGKVSNIDKIVSYYPDKLTLVDCKRP